MEATLEEPPRRTDLGERRSDDGGRGAHGGHDSPHADLEHAAEQLGAVGDGPADVDDQLLLDDRLPLVVGVALVDDVLDHPRGQRVGDHLLLVPEGAQRDLGEKELSSHLPAAHAAREAQARDWRLHLP